VAEARRRGGALGACLLVAAIAFAAAGCGGSGSPSSAAATVATTTTAGAANGRNRTAAFQAFTACLAKHGVTNPGFRGFNGRTPRAGGNGGGTRTTPQGAPPSGARRPTLTKAQQQALQACRSTLPAGSGVGPFGGRAGGGNRTQNPAFAKYTSCLKAHGVTFGKSSSTATFQKAQKACAKYRPSVGPGGGAGGGATTSTGGSA
jgi:hypothetical protein